MASVTHQQIEQLLVAGILSDALPSDRLDHVAQLPLRTRDAFLLRGGESVLYDISTGVPRFVAQRWGDCSD